MTNLQTRDIMSAAFSSLPYHHLIQEHALLFSEETLSFHWHLGACQWTCLISGFPAGAISHQLAIAFEAALPTTSGKTTVTASLPMVCTCSPIRTVAITISSKCSCTFHECYRRQRIVSFWRLCTQLRVSQQ